MLGEPGHTQGPTGPYTRIVENVQIHRESLSPEALFARVITADTKYLVLDLDRTIHRGVNIGERLGWELVAHSIYGVEQMRRAEPRRDISRFFFDWSMPLRSARYLARGVRLWAFPGLYYLFLGKIAYQFGWSRKLLHRYLGPDPIRHVQAVPRIALMHHLSEFPLDTLREITRRLWHRLRDWQVFTAEDFARLKARYPRLQIIISSASPQPVLEIAAEALGVDGVVYSAIEEWDGFLSSPHQYNWTFLLPRRPRRIAPPESLRHNASVAKRDNLLAHYPDFCDPGIETVGITDTAYGEDHEWANFCTRVVDVNSPTPFPPVVAANSPLREVHSVRMLPQSQRSAAESRPTTGSGFDRETLQRRLGALAQRIEAYAQEYHQQARALATHQAAIDGALSLVRREIERAVHTYNLGVPESIRPVLRDLRQALRQQGLLHKQRARLLRPLSRLVNAIREDASFSRAILASG